LLCAHLYNKFNHYIHFQNYYIKLVIVLFFQQIKRQFGIASRITGAAAGASVRVAAAAALLNVARHI
jgi:hypothetical protein